MKVQLEGVILVGLVRDATTKGASTSLI